MLTGAQITQFIHHGFVKLASAFPRDVAEQCRSILWRETGCSESDPATWTKPVIRLGSYSQEPFVAAANTPVLHRAFDQLVDPGRWRRPNDLGTFPIRFPSPDDPGDAGTVYLCHPFVVHAAQLHRGSRPRFLAQPPLMPAEPFLLDRADGAYCPVERAIRLALQ